MRIFHWPVKWEPETEETKNGNEKEQVDRGSDQEQGCAPPADGNTIGPEDPLGQAGKSSEVKGEAGEEGSAGRDTEKNETLIHLGATEMGLKLSTISDRLELYMPRHEVNAADLICLRDGLQATEAIINIMLKKMGQLESQDAPTTQ